MRFIRWHSYLLPLHKEMSSATHLKKYSVADLREFIRAESVALKGYSKMNRKDLVDVITGENQDNGRFSDILSEKVVQVPLVATVKELREARKAVRDVMQLPKNERRKALKGGLQRRLYKRELAKNK